MRFNRTKKAQGATEYAIFIAAVLAGLLALQVYYSRSVKGNMKGRADSIGEQFDASTGVSYNKETRSVSGSVSSTNTGAEGGAWSRNNITSGDNQKVQDLMGSINSLGVGSQHTGSWSGGSVSSTDYVDDQGNHATYDMSDVSGGSKSVWD